MLDIDKMIITAAEKGCHDALEALLKNRDALADVSEICEDFDDECQEYILEKLLLLEGANPGLTVTENFLKKTDAFNLGNILDLYISPPAHFSAADTLALIKHYLDKTQNAKEWIDSYLEPDYLVLVGAVHKEDKDMVQLLLTYGANPNVYATDSWGEALPVLGLTIIKGNKEIARLLLENGASVKDLIHNLPEEFDCYDYSPLKLLKSLTEISADLGKFDDKALVDEALRRYNNT